jgi:thiol-disulfide isomerase/thioredoxin
MTDPMISSILLRLVLSIGIFLAGWALYRLFQILQLNRAAQNAALPPGVLPGKIAVVLFSSPECSVCKTVQRPILTRLVQSPDLKIQVVEVDVDKHPGICQEWGIMSVPTLYILDKTGAPKFVNNGVVPFEKLQDTIHAIQAKTYAYQN